MKKALENAKGGVAVDRLTVNNIRLDDDIDLVSQSLQQLQEIIIEVNTNSKRFGLRTNEHKAKITWQLVRNTRISTYYLEVVQWKL